MLPASNVIFDAERAVLGSMILVNRAIRDVRRYVVSESFATLAHMLIFDAICHLADDRCEVDFVTLRNYLSSKQDILGGSHLKQCGGTEYITMLCEFVPSAANAMHYAKNLRDIEAARMASCVFQEDLFLAFAKSKSIDNPTEAAIAFAKHVATESERIKNRGESLLVSFRDGLKDHDTKLCNAMEGGSAAFTSGYPSIDADAGGYFGGDLVIIGGYSGSGKTSFVFESMMRSAKLTRRPWLFISGEMGVNDLVSRFITTRTGVSVIGQRSGQISDRQYSQIIDAQENSFELPIYLYRGTPSLAQIEAMVVEIKQRHGDIAGVVADYLQLMVKGRAADRVSEIEAFCYGMKNMAGDYNFTPILLSQLNRASRNQDRAPDLEDLKGSGGIEASADWVFMVSTPYKRGMDPAMRHTYHVDIAKARFGPCTSYKFEWLPCRTMFFDPMGEVQPALSLIDNTNSA